MSTLSSLLGLARGSAVAVVGCGGKSSIIQLLAAQNSAGSVLVCPTTKILMPQTGRIIPEGEAAAHLPRQGIQYMGASANGGQKLAALPPAMLAAAVQKGYNLTLMEADGSRGLPCKGWLPTEPVVPAFTTHTVGVVPACAPGLAATAQNVLRLPQFLALTGLAEGDITTAGAVADMVAAPSGMFKNAVGKTALIVNQTDLPGGPQAAQKIITAIQQRYPGRIQTFIVGSAKTNTWTQIF